MPQGYWPVYNKLSATALACANLLKRSWQNAKEGIFAYGTCERLIRSVYGTGLWR